MSDPVQISQIRDGKSPSICRHADMPELNMSDLVRTEQVWSCPVLQIRYEEGEGEQQGSTKLISKGLDSFTKVCFCIVLLCLVMGVDYYSNKTDPESGVGSNQHCTSTTRNCYRTAVVEISLCYHDHNRSSQSMFFLQRYNKRHGMQYHMRANPTDIGATASLPYVAYAMMHFWTNVRLCR